jgi:hypothetical protein
MGHLIVPGKSYAKGQPEWLALVVKDSDAL